MLRSGLGKGSCWYSCSKHIRVLMNSWYAATTFIYIIWAGKINYVACVAHASTIYLPTKKLKKNGNQEQILNEIHHC